MGNITLSDNILLHNDIKLENSLKNGRKSLVGDVRRFYPKKAYRNNITMKVIFKFKTEEELSDDMDISMGSFGFTCEPDIIIPCTFDNWCLDVDVEGNAVFMGGIISPYLSTDHDELLERCGTDLSTITAKSLAEAKIIEEFDFDIYSEDTPYIINDCDDDEDAMDMVKYNHVTSFELIGIEFSTSDKDGKISSFSVNKDVIDEFNSDWHGRI